MIELKNVYKRYVMGKSELAVLENINLKIEQGEFVSLVGPSGSGKSTIMNLIGGLDKPTQGNIMVDNFDISSFNDVKLSEYRNKKIGFVFQSFNLEPTLTALENVMLPMIFAGISKGNRREKAQKALEMVQLGERMKHKPTEMSGGERQRVSIARALVNDPKIVLADEPTGNLDSKTGVKIMELLRRLNNQGYTILMVTHNMEEAKNTGRMIFIRDGVIV